MKRGKVLCFFLENRFRRLQKDHKAFRNNSNSQVVQNIRKKIKRPIALSPKMVFPLHKFTVKGQVLISTCPPRVSLTPTEVVCVNKGQPFKSELSSLPGSLEAQEASSRSQQGFAAQIRSPDSQGPSLNPRHLFSPGKPSSEIKHQQIKFQHCH